MPSPLMSPSSVGLWPTRPAPRWMVACDGGVAGTASLGRPVAPLGANSPASRTSSATKYSPQRLPADMRASPLGGKAPTPVDINGLDPETLPLPPPTGPLQCRSGLVASERVAARPTDGRN